MKRIWILGLVFLFNWAGARTFSQQELVERGSFRLSDIFLHYNPTSQITRDDFLYTNHLLNYRLSNSGTYNIFINGHEFGASIFSGSQLNWLPVGINGIDSVRIIDRNTLFKGTMLQNGVVQIFTNLHDRGLSGGGTLFMGNESEDPGPFQYTELSSRNVDRIGKNLNSWIAYNSGQFHGAAYLNYRTKSYTDSRIYDQVNQNFSREWLGSKQYSSAIMLASKQHSVWGSRSQGNLCFFFLPGISGAVPSDLIYDHFSYKGIFASNSKYQLQASSVYEHYQTEYVKNKSDLKLNWNLKTIKNSLEIKTPDSSIKYILGLRHEGYYFRQNYGHHFLAGYASLISEYNQHSTALNMVLKRSVSEASHRNLVKMAIDQNIVINENKHLFINAYAQNYSHAEEPDFNFFLSQGLIDISNYNQRNAFTSYGLNAGLRISARVDLARNRIELGLPLNFSRGYNSILPGILLDELEPEKTDYWNLAGGINMEWQYRINSLCSAAIFTQYLRHSFSKNIGLPDNSAKVWKSVLNFKYKPASDFSANLQANHIYNNFAPLPYLKSKIFTIDATFVKHLYNNRFTITLMLRNLNNNRYWLHPDGAGFDRSMYLGMSAIF